MFRILWVLIIARNDAFEDILVPPAYLEKKFLDWRSLDGGISGVMIHLGVLGD